MKKDTPLLFLILMTACSLALSTVALSSGSQDVLKKQIVNNGEKKSKEKDEEKLPDEIQERVDALKKQNDKLSKDEAIKQVYMNLDRPAYETSTDVSNPNDILVVVNKFNCLNPEYTPQDLEIIPASPAAGTLYMRKEAADAFKNLVQDAKQAGFELNANDAYRSYKAQEDLYNYGISQSGIVDPDAYWIRPSYSETQTGLSADSCINNDTSALDAVLNYPEAMKWLNKNLADYGFILRYPKGKEVYTLISYEP